MRLVNIGYGNMISASRVIATVTADSAPIKRMISEARGKSGLIDATYGRKTRTVIIMDNNMIILSALQPETVSARISGEAPND